MLTENLNNSKYFEHLFSIARRVGKVDDLLTDLNFQLPQTKTNPSKFTSLEKISDLSFNVWVAMGIWRYVITNQSKEFLS